MHAFGDARDVSGRQFFDRTTGVVDIEILPSGRDAGQAASRPLPAFIPGTLLSSTSVYWTSGGWFRAQSKVYKVGWWMAHYGSKSPKRHQGLSNNRWVERYNLGKLKKASMKKDPTFQPSKSYVDKAGRKRWQGTKQLKQTQSGPLFVINMWQPYEAT